MALTKQQVVDWLMRCGEVFTQQRDFLTRLDTEIGDADHGLNMNRGFNKVVEKLPSVADKDIGFILKNTGMTLLSSVGGASGPLFGTFFIRAAQAANAKQSLDLAELHQMVQEGVDGVVMRDFDLVVATGDLAQDHSLAAYQHFAEGIARLPAPCVWLPGNHDFQPAMVDALAAAGIAPSKHVLVGDHWQVLLLDSQVFGVPHGELSEYQLEWMERCLQAYPDRYTLMLLHHHPLPSGCTWLDQHSLRNPHMLGAILLRYPKVNTLLCGHIHQELDLEWQGRRLLASPSTCVQFKPHCTNFTIDDVSPGWRYLDLLPDGRIETQVFRLENDDFRPDMDSDGY